MVGVLGSKIVGNFPPPSDFFFYTVFTVSVNVHNTNI
jgi:hypothetical protein